MRRRRRAFIPVWRANFANRRRRRRRDSRVQTRELLLLLLFQARLRTTLKCVARACVHPDYSRAQQYTHTDTDRQRESH